LNDVIAACCKLWCDQYLKEAKQGDVNAMMVLAQVISKSEGICFAFKTPQLNCLLFFIAAFYHLFFYDMTTILFYFILFIIFIFIFVHISTTIHVAQS
jgi:hypothetical protein